MTRDDLGWSPHLGPGYSKVAIYENASRTEYRLYGFRMHDKTVSREFIEVLT